MQSTSKGFALIGLLLLVVFGSKSYSDNLQRIELFRHPGQQWLSWTSTEKDNFVYGYIQGYGHGMNEACLAADALFEVDRPHAIGHDNLPPTFPSARCRAKVPQYKNTKVNESKGPDFSPYTETITDFYTKYPTYRDIPFTHLLEFLTDATNVTAESLLARLQGSKSTLPGK